MALLLQWIFTDVRVACTIAAVAFLGYLLICLCFVNVILGVVVTFAVVISNHLNFVPMCEAWLFCYNLISPLVLFFHRFWLLFDVFETELLLALTKV